MRVCQVAIPTPIPRLFDYLLPDAMMAPARGARVAVPFGRRRGVVGIALGVVGQSVLPRHRLRAIEGLLDQTPLLPEELLGLLLWAAQYYHHPLGEVLSAALPARLRQGSQVELPAHTVWRLTNLGAATPADALRAPLQRRLLAALHAAPEHQLDRTGVLGVGERAMVAMRALAEKGLVGAHMREYTEQFKSSSVERHALNPDQAKAVAALQAARGFQPFLLRGVTGSGKTEVYLQAVERVLGNGGSALVLVPEIGLTPQLIERFQSRLGVPLAVLHSGLGEAERATAWLKARAGKAPIVLGTRSAVFTPIPRLGLIVVDEEHDASYKQQDGFRYSARDVAVMRASRAGVPIVLGSATPSLESLSQARSGNYRLLELHERATATAALPPVELLDLRRLVVEDGLSHPLRTAIAERLARGEQSLLFLNRRGFAPVWMCVDCGFIAPCRRCDARLTYHRATARLICHHCGAEAEVPATCPACQGTRLHAQGEGTERVEAALARHFAGARVLRIDRDTTRRKGALATQLASVHAGDADILVGTQMLSKGHDFPNVTLVGVLNADQGLYSADFRGPERLFQQIVQVAGRAGRAARPGRVLIQTYHPEHPIFTALRAHDYVGFADYALAERRAAGYPPFRHLALLRAESPKPGAPLAFLRRARAFAGAAPATVELMEPVAAPMERRAGRYRAQLLVQASARKPLHAFLDTWLVRIWDSKEAKRVRWSIDVDPIDMY